MSDFSTSAHPITTHDSKIRVTIRSVSRFATYEFLGGEDLANREALTVALKIHAKMLKEKIVIKDDLYTQTTYRGF